MSKITNDGTNDGLTRSVTGCFITSCTYMATVGVKGLKQNPLVCCSLIGCKRAMMTSCQQ